MEFMNRGAAQAAPVRVNGPTTGGGKRGRWKDGPMWMRIIWVVLLFSATAVLVLIAFLLSLGRPDEASQIDTTKQQAVFLTNGQVYFGKIKAVNGKYLDLRGIYYLNVNQQVQPNQEDQKAQNSISLVKLGCELHGPMDQMIINRDQVTFWENLKDSGQVTKAIAEWVKQNPNGQKCQTGNQ
jgi:hypothetical protein